MNKDEVLHNALEFEHEFKDSKMMALKARADYLELAHNQSLTDFILYFVIGVALCISSISTNDIIFAGFALGIYGLFALFILISAIKERKEQNIIEKEIWRLRGK